MNSYNTVLYISNKSLYLKNLIRLEKMSMIFEFSIKKTALKSTIIYLILKTLQASIIIVVNGIGDFSSNSGQGCLHFTLYECSLGKVWIHLFSPSYGWIIEQTGFFIFG